MCRGPSTRSRPRCRAGRRRRVEHDRPSRPTASLAPMAPPTPSARAAAASRPAHPSCRTAQGRPGGRALCTITVSRGSTCARCASRTPDARGSSLVLAPRSFSRSIREPGVRAHRLAGRARAGPPPPRGRAPAPRRGPGAFSRSSHWRGHGPAVVPAMRSGFGPGLHHAGLGDLPWTPLTSRQETQVRLRPLTFSNFMETDTRRSRAGVAWGSSGRSAGC